MDLAQVKARPFKQTCKKKIGVCKIQQNLITRFHYFFFSIFKCGMRILEISIKKHVQQINYKAETKMNFYL